MAEYALDVAERARVEQWIWDRRDDGVRDLLCALSYNPRRIIELRYGLADGHRYTLEETANVFSKPVNWVTAIESFALFRLHEILTTMGKFDEKVKH